MTMALVGLQGRKADMGRMLVNKIPQLLAEMKMSELDFKAECMRQGLSVTTAERLLDPDYNPTVETLAKAARALKLNSIACLIDLDKPE